MLVAALIVLVTLPLLPWATFIADVPMITANLVRQNHGNSVFGAPLLMAVAVVALLSFGFRRPLWPSVPLLRPLSQPICKAVTLPPFPRS